MRPSDMIVLGLMLAVHITAHPIDGDHVRAAEIFQGHQPIPQPRQEPVISELAPFPTGLPILPPPPEAEPAPAPAPPPAPAPAPAPPAPATQSCTATDHGAWVSYSVLIRIPYRGAKDCDDTYHALEDADGLITNWQCVEKGGFIQLWFNTEYGDSYLINPALESRYPSVDSFNCPDR